MTKLYPLTVALVAAAFFAIPAAWGGDTFSDNSKIKESGFLIDYAYFKSERPGLNRLEIYYQIFNSNLQFVNKDGNYSAAYELQVSVSDENGRKVASYTREKSYSVGSYDETVSDHDYRVSQINFHVPAGKFKIEFAVYDNNSSATTRKILKANLRQFDNAAAQISGIEFARAVDTLIYDSLFLKGDKTVIPSVTRQYGGDSTAYLLYYQELYQGSDNREEVKVETQIFDRNTDAVYRDTLTSTFLNGLAREIRRISLAGLKAGQYTLEITLKGRRDRVVESIRETFAVNWSADALVRNDFDKAVLQLRYIATPQEMDAFKKAKSHEERLRVWNDFWFQHDPSPGTPANEYKNDYYRRIEFANLYFGVLKKEGWRTDRGMVFITYGEPDQIEDYPFELDSKAYQVWYYYQSNNVRRFVFVDDWNDGDYRLQMPYDGIIR